MKSTAYLFSAKKGVPSFTYREIELLLQNNYRLTLLVTKYGLQGTRIKPEWDVVYVSKKAIIVGVLSALWKYRGKICVIAKESIADDNLYLFLVALGFAQASGNRVYDSIHVQMADHKLAIGYYLARILEIPITAKIHAHELYTRRIYERSLVEKKYLLYCKKLITISKFNRDVLVNEIGIPKEKINVMYLYPSFIKKPIDQVRVLIVANWVRKKGYLTLLQAFSLVVQDCPNAVLWIVGGPIESGNDQDIDVPRLVRDMGITDYVVVFGSVESKIVQLLVSSCDIFCLPSETDFYADGRVREREGIPVSLMEAMLEEKPVVTTRHAGIPELVDNNLISEGDFLSLANVIKELILDPLKRRELGIVNKTKIETMFNESNVQQLTHVLSEVNSE